MCAYHPRRTHSNNLGAAPGHSGYRGNNTNNVASPSASRPSHQQSVPTLAGGTPQRVAEASVPPTVASTDATSSSTATPTDSPLVIDGAGGRILCVADVRGNLKVLNELAAKYNAQAIIHTGDFGFYASDSLSRIGDKPLRHLVQYSRLISEDHRTRLLAADQTRAPPSGGPNQFAANMRTQISNSPNPLLSEFQLLLDGRLKFDVPVFAIYGACEDVAVIERIRAGEFQIPNLQILDEATTRAIHVGDIRLRLYGLGGAVVLHKLFDNGDGAATIAGGQGLMWTTMLQIGELVDTAQKTYDPTETRVLVTHACPGREGLLTQLAVVLKADVTISAGLHFRYGVSYNEFSVQHDSQNYRNKMTSARAAFGEIWDGVKTQVEEAVTPQQRILLDRALDVTNRLPISSTATGAVSEEFAWKNTWNWNLPDVAHGSLVLDVNEGRLGAETFSAGNNFAFRKAVTRGVASVTPAAPQASITSPAVRSAVASQPSNASLAVKADGTPSAYPKMPTVPRPPTARPPMAAALPSRATGGPSVAGIRRTESPHATPPTSAAHSSTVRSTPTGPASSGPGPASLIKSPPMGPRGYQHHSQQGTPIMHARGGRAGGGGAGRGSGPFANGSAPSTDNETKAVVTKKPQQPKQLEKPAEVSGQNESTSTAQPLTEVVKASGNTSGAAETKTKKPRPPKKGKGGAGATVNPAETSGGEALTSGAESTAILPATTTKKEGPRQQDGRRKDKDRGQQPATPRTGAPPAAATATKVATPSETPAVKSSGDEASAPSLGTQGASRGDRNVGRGGGRGGRGRGGRGGRGAGIAGSASDSSAPAPAPAPAPAAPAAVTGGK